MPESILYIVIASLVTACALAVKKLIDQNKKLTEQAQILSEQSFELQQNKTKATDLAIELQQAKDTSLNFQTQVNLAQQALAKAEAEQQGIETRLNERDTQIAELKHSLEVNIGEYKQLQSQHSALVNEQTELKTTQEQQQQYFQQQKQDFSQQKEQLKNEFSHLAQQILEEKGKSFSQSNKSELTSLLTPFKEQVEGFQKRVNEVHTESVKGQTTLATELKKVLDIGVQMSDEANNLTKALKGDKKTMGNWGEVQLERALQSAGLLKGEHYDTQSSYDSLEGQKRLPDFVVKLPDDKHIILDSKVSLIAYDQAIAAETEADTESALLQHINAVKNHIDDLSKKDYTNLIGIRSPSFVLMFMPIEPAYIEALKHQKDLFSYGYDKNVILVSYTTLMPILKTVSNLWRMERGNKEAQELSSKAAEIYNQVCLVAERFEKLGRTLNTVNKQYNEAVKGLAGKQGLAGKVDRFSQLSSKASKQMPELEPIHSDVEHEKLSLIAEAVGGVSDKEE